MVPLMDSRSRSRSWSFSLPIEASRICWPWRSHFDVVMILLNWSSVKCSRLRTSRFSTPYSGSSTNRYRYN